MHEMIEVEIDSIRVSLMSQNRVVFLKDRESTRYLPIWIGVYEAESITIALQGVEVARPLTHDLMRNIFNDLDARIVRVEVVELKEDTFFGSIVAEINNHLVNIDSRPSDALAIAVRAHVPILVAKSVMEIAAIIPDADLRDSTKESLIPPPPSDEPETGEDRLSIFSDFLDKLDFDSLDKDKPEDKPEE
jgi:bifunctional DNase/RNase